MWLREQISYPLVTMRNMLFRSTSTTTKPPIVIVGGGPVGLLLSLLLSEYRVPSIVIEAQTPTVRFRHPQAHFLNTRTMEILRHCLGPSSNRDTHQSVYQRVVAAMPPVRQWNSFRFGASMVAPPLAVVRHPVHQPLQLNQDANGVLLHHDGQDDAVSITSSAALSPCTVGHLAQHTFGRILYEEALLRTDMISLRYGVKVEHARFNPPTGRFRISTTQSPSSSISQSPTHGDDAAALETDVCVAADGAHSNLRKQFDIGVRLTVKGASSSDPAVLQHLVNIHVQLPEERAISLHKNNNFAMLYSIYSSTVVAMVVCHSVGDYIVQIPYFPPYQTVEVDFGPPQLTLILQAIFGPQHAKDCTIRSVKPWTMTSFVADRFYKVFSADDNRSGSGRNLLDAGLLLVGDAAHVFPPVGGFGMNTGLQDAHNVAWKLATLWSNDEIGKCTDNGDSKAGVSSLKLLLSSYERERQPVAEQNAALSIRNYRRLLTVVESLYLYEQHPTSLQHVLDQSTLLPLSARQALFRSLLQTALFPLSWLHDPHNSYTQHVQSNLRRVLNQGAGLPLLFPKFEIGFTYGNSAATCDTSEEWSTDTLPHEPGLFIGRLVPHVVVRILFEASDWTRLQPLDDSEPSSATLSTVDLPSQMRRDNRPSFVLLWIEDGAATRTNVDKQTQIQAIGRMLSQKLCLPVEVALLYKSGFEPIVPTPTNNAPHTTQNILVLSECQGKPRSFSFFRFNEQQPKAVMIRPDGHIAGLVNVSRSSDVDLDDSLSDQTVCNELLQQIDRFW